MAKQKSKTSPMTNDNDLSVVPELVTMTIRVPRPLKEFMEECCENSGISPEIHVGLMVQDNLLDMTEARPYISDATRLTEGDWWIVKARYISYVRASEEEFDG